MYAISGIKKEDGSRVFLGNTKSQYFLWTKNKDYIRLFESINDAVKFWEAFKPKASPLMLHEVAINTLAVGNLDFNPRYYLHEKGGNDE